jgi:hypothetical protein
VKEELQEAATSQLVGKPVDASECAYERLEEQGDEHGEKTVTEYMIHTFQPKPTSVGAEWNQTPTDCDHSGHTHCALTTCSTATSRMTSAIMKGEPSDHVKASTAAMFVGAANSMLEQSETSQQIESPDASRTSGESDVATARIGASESNEEDSISNAMGSRSSSGALEIAC